MSHHKGVDDNAQLCTGKNRVHYQIKLLDIVLGRLNHQNARVLELLVEAHGLRECLREAGGAAIFWQLFDQRSDSLKDAELLVFVGQVFVRLQWVQ